MTVATQQVETEVQIFHRNLVPQNDPTRLWIHHFEEGKFKGRSYKDIFAQAHCTAAYLMSKGLQKGSRVLIFSSHSPFYLILDLALQYIGAVNITVEPDAPEDQIDSLFAKHNIEFAFFEEDAPYIRLNELNKFKNGMREIAIQKVSTDNLPPNKLVTFEIVVNLGKSEWREQAPRLQEMKMATSPKDLYCLLFQPDSNSWKEVLYADFLKKVAEAADFLKSGNHARVLTMLHPSYLFQRTFGFFAPLQLNLPVYSTSPDHLDPTLLKKVKPTAFTASPESLSTFYSHLPEKFFPSPEKGNKALEKVHKVCKNREELLAENKKVPFMARRRYASLKSKIFSRIRTKMGGKLSTIIYLKGIEETECEAFFKYAGFELKEVGIE